MSNSIVIKLLCIHLKITQEVGWEMWEGIDEKNTGHKLITAEVEQ